MFTATGPGTSRRPFPTTCDAWRHCTRAQMAAEDAAGNVDAYDGTDYSLLVWDLDHAPGSECGHPLAADGTGLIGPYAVTRTVA